MDSKQVVKEWIQSNLKINIEKNSGVELKNIMEDDEKLILDFGVTQIELTNEEIGELFIIHNDIGNMKSDDVNGIYKYEDEKYILPITSDNKKLKLNNNQSSINFLVNSNRDYFNVQIENTLNLRLMFILISKGIELKFNLTNSNGEFKRDLIDCFENISFLLFDFDKCKDNVQDIEDIISIVLSTVYYMNNILNTLIVPEKLCNNSSLNYFDIERDTDETVDVITLPFNLFELEPIIYYLVGMTHDDFRFKYLDIYHVLEFYFDRSALSNIRNMLKVELSNPIIYFDDNLANDLAKKLKDIVVGDKRNYKEEESLLLVLKLIDFDNIIREVGSISGNIITLCLPEIKINGKQELNQIEIIYDVVKKEYKLNRDIVNKEKVLENIRKRIYAIRNSIAHSKEEFTWRLKPNSDEVKKLEQDDLKLLKAISNNVLNIFKSNI